MNTHRLGSSWGISFENLENRRLLSVSVPVAMLPLPIAAPVPVAPVSPIAASVAGRTIHAEANQAFKAVIGIIPEATKFPTSDTLHGIINWGDGSAPTAATFVRKANGSIAVIGSHTYTAVGTDSITAVITAVPPAGSLAPILVLGQIHSAAKVISSTGGVTLDETANVPFTATVGSFGSTLTGLTFTATIDWGDGTTSVGKILALPVAFGQGGQYQVQGTHTYANTQSYLVHVVVTAAPTPVPGKPTPQFEILVADIDSVIDVLPVSPIAAT